MTKKRRNLRILASIIAAGCVWATGMSNAWAAGGTGYVYNPELTHENGLFAGASPNESAYGFNHNYYLQMYDINDGKNFNVSGNTTAERNYDATWDRLVGIKLVTTHDQGNNEETISPVIKMKVYDEAGKNVIGEAPLRIDGAQFQHVRYDAQGKVLAPDNTNINSIFLYDASNGAITSYESHYCGESAQSISVGQLQRMVEIFYENDVNLMRALEANLGDTTLDTASLVVGNDGSITMKVKDTSGKEVTGTDSIAGYVNKQIYNNAGSALYEGNTTINQQITENKDNIAENTQVINNHTKQISQNTTNITNNKNEIDNIKKKYVQQITENNAGDAWTVTQTDGGTITIKDTYVTDMTHELDANGNLVTTVYQNQGEDPITASVKIGDANISYNDYQNSNEQNEYTVTKLTIEQAINQNATYIDNINDNNVTNVTKQVTNDDRDIWEVTQTVNGTPTTVQITDEHINSYSMNVVGDSIESQITTNFGGNFEQSVRVGNATIRYEGDTGTQNVSTIEQAINKNYTKIENVENNYVTNISKRQEGTEVINNKTYNVEYYQVTQNVTDANGNTTVETINIKDTTLVPKRVTSGSVPNASANNALSYDFDPNTGIPQVFVEFEDTSGNVVQGAIDVASLMVTTADTTDGNIEVEGNGQGFGKDYRLADNININRSLTVNNNVTVNPDGRISGVADGEISANSTEAINGSQLWETNRNMDKLGGRLDKVGAGAAALAALHPMDFDPDDKLQFSAGVGNYKGETAAALGAFYRPTEKVMFSVAGTMGNGENMVNAGVTFALDRKNNVSNSRVAMAHEIQDLRDQVAALTALVSQIAGKGNPLLDTVMFPDVPENHWAYDYVENLQKRGIIEGYPDGNFGGDRSMTRYEYAAMLYRALEKGFPVDGRLLKEFEAELGRIRIDRIKGEDADANKVERVRVNDYEDRDDYGSKLAQVVADAVPVVEEEPAA